jgi:hypothetical protein
MRTVWSAISAVCNFGGPAATLWQPPHDELPTGKTRRKIGNRSNARRYTVRAAIGTQDFSAHVLIKPA